jgi:signal transduction histidine kinase
MRKALAQTIDHLREERAGLETNVARRTRELSSSLEDLKQAQSALVQGERMALIGELVASVAHEIYNPLNAIAGSVSSLERISSEVQAMIGAYREAEAELPEPRRGELERRRAELDIDGTLDDLAGVVKVVQSATRRSVEIVTTLRSFARAPGEPIPSDLTAGLEETLSLLRHRLERRSIEVIARHEPLPEVVCRTGEINQVFMNLLTNAIQAIEERTAKDHSRGVIVVATRPEGSGVTISISDNGPGVPDDLRERVFDPFFTTKSREGTGLGLSISREIVRRHGGTLELERAEELGGARFVCRLPLNPPQGMGRGAPLRATNR